MPQLNRIKNAVIYIWETIPIGLRVKPLDALVSLLLIMYALSIGGLSTFDPFDFLGENLTFDNIIEVFVTIYLIFGSFLILFGLLFHQTHQSILSFCKSEIWGWRLIFSACSVIFLAEMTHGWSLATVIWLLQAIASCFKMLQYYSERRLERNIWTQ